MAPIKVNLATAPLSMLVALAKSYARDIDRGDRFADELRIELEIVFSHIPYAREARFQ